MCEDLLSYKKLEESGYLSSEYIRKIMKCSNKADLIFIVLFGVYLCFNLGTLTILNNLWMREIS